MVDAREDPLEARVRAWYLGAAEPPVPERLYELVARLGTETSPTNPVRHIATRRRAPAGSFLVAVLVAAAILVVGVLFISSLHGPGSLGPSVGPTASAPASPTPVAAALAPYRLSLAVTAGRSPGPTLTISTAADCASLPAGWDTQFCALVLRSTWESIIGQVDPFGPPASPPVTTSGTGPSVTWYAALARAEIDGDASICRDVATETWITFGTGLGGAAPQAGSSISRPVHPIAFCLADLRRKASEGAFTVESPPYKVAGVLTGDTINMFVDPGAVARLAGASAPPNDPAIACAQGQLTRDACQELVDAAEVALGSRLAAVQDLGAYGQPIPCRSRLVSPCPPPPSGTWLGSVIANLGAGGFVAFDGALVGGQLQVTEVPFAP